MSDENTIPPAPPPEPIPPETPEPPLEPTSPEPSPAGSASTTYRSELPPLSLSDERTWAMLSHLTVLLNLVTGFLGPVAALVIYLVYKDRSRLVAYHSLQSAIFQAIFWVGGGALIGVIWTVTGLLTAIFVGLLCIPFSVLLTLVFAAAPLLAIVYGIIGAIDVSQGRPFKYWLVGDWVKGTLQPIT